VGSEAAQAEVQDREHIEALGRAGGREGRQAGQGSEVAEGKKALEEVLGLVQPQILRVVLQKLLMCWVD